MNAGKFSESPRKPLDPQKPPSKEPLTLKLKYGAIVAAFEEADQPLKNAVDDNARHGVDRASRGRREGQCGDLRNRKVEGFPVLPTVRNFADVRAEVRQSGARTFPVCLSISTELKARPTWAGEVVPQSLGEIKAILAAHNNVRLSQHNARESMVRWFQPV